MLDNPTLIRLLTFKKKKLYAQRRVRTHNPQDQELHALLPEPAWCPVGLLTLCTLIQKAFTGQDRMKSFYRFRDDGKERYC